MATALIMMTFLGCNDALSACDYIETARRKWETVQTCDAASTRMLKHHVNANYPNIIAVCEAPHTIIAAQDQPEPQAAAPATTAPAPMPSANDAATQNDDRQSFADRIGAEVRAHLPSGAGMRQRMMKPVHFVSQSYSWAVQRLTK